MKKFSYVSKKLLKDMGAGGGGDPTLPERVTAIEDEIDANKDQLIFRVQMVPEVIGTTGTLEHYLLSEQLYDAIAAHSRQFDTVVISGNNPNNPLKGEYHAKNNFQWQQTDLLAQKEIYTYQKQIAYAKTHTLKADLTTGAVAYDSGTNIDLTYTDSYMDFKFYTKGVLKS